MRTTKEQRDRLRKSVPHIDPPSEVVIALLDDADRAWMADEAVSTIALAAGLGADATAEEVVARVGEMRGRLAKVDAGLARIVDAEDALEFARELGWPRG